MEFRLLGPLETRVDGEPVRVPPKQRAVLAALLLARNAVVSADALMAALWVEPPRSARNQVQVYMSALRRQLGAARSSQPPAAPVAIETHPAGYRLRLPPVALDLYRFESLVADAERRAAAGDLLATSERLRAALELWRGPALANVDGPFAAAEAARLGERRLAVAERRIDADMALRRHAELVPELTALVAQYPLHEGIRQRLMLALYACGRGAQALAVYRDGRRALVADLGIEPGPALRELEVAILRGEAVAGPDAGVPAPLRVASPQVCQLPAASDIFVGRESVTRDLLDLLAVPRVAPPTVVLTGAPGVGKSALAVQVAHRARSYFPDGVLHVDMRGSSHSPVDPRDALADLVVALGGLSWQVATGDRVARYRALLADRRVLVLLDDVRDERQVRPLLPTAAGSAALVCGRGGLAALGGIRVAVPVLTPADATAMFAAVAGASRVEGDRDAAAAVVAACAYLPLAVHIAGCRLAARPHRTVRWLAGLLADPYHRLDELVVGDLSVRDAYDGTWDRLSAAARRALTTVADLAEVTAATVAGRLDIGVAAAELTVDELVDVHLLEPVAVGEPICYRTTELTRRYAVSRGDT